MNTTQQRMRLLKIGAMYEILIEIPLKCFLLYNFLTFLNLPNVSWYWVCGFAMFGIISSSLKAVIRNQSEELHIKAVIAEAYNTAIVPNLRKEIIDYVTGKCK